MRSRNPQTDLTKQAEAVRKPKSRMSRSSRSAVIMILVLSVPGLAAIGWARGWFDIRGTSTQTLAVLPVKPWCGDPEAEGCCEAMTHELIAALTAGTALKVTPRLRCGNTALR